MNQLLIIYLGIINLITFIVFAVDKSNAVAHRFRVRERTLLCLSLVGGAAGGLLAMQIFRHKTRKPLFRIGVPLILVLQIVGLVYQM